MSCHIYFILAKYLARVGYGLLHDLGHVGYRQEAVLLAQRHARLVARVVVRVVRVLGRQVVAVIWGTTHRAIDGKFTTVETLLVGWDGLFEAWKMILKQFFEVRNRKF